MTRSGISAVLCVHNEEALLPDCLSSLGFADEIVVVLDKCTDGSKLIAEGAGARIHEGAWEFEGERRNQAIDLAAGPWIFEIDADERVTAELAEEILSVVRDGGADIYNIMVDNYVGGRHIRFGWGGNFGKAGYPGLFRMGMKRWGGGRVHPDLHVTGVQGPDLTHHAIHHIDTDMSAMLRRLDRYTTAHAEDMVDKDEIGSLPNMVRKLISRFWRCYVGRRGYREGGHGIVIALCAGLYPLLSHLKATLEVVPHRENQGGVQ